MTLTKAAKSPDSFQIQIRQNQIDSPHTNGQIEEA